MTASELSSDVIERSRAAQGKHINLFDGVCGLCNKSVQYVLDNDGPGQFYYAALQSNFAMQALGKFGIDPSDLDSIRVLENYSTGTERLYARSDAALFVLRKLGGWRVLPGSLTWIPRPLRDAVYRMIAVVRYKLFGKSDTCRLPDPATRARFIEV